MNEKFPACSVLIVVKDEPSIAETLQALKPQCDQVGAECIVVDSSDGRLHSISLAQSWAKWVSYQQPIGSKSTISEQRNLGVNSASSDILIFCDAGSLPSSGWLKAMYSALSSGRYRVVGGPLEFFDANRKFLFNRNFCEAGGEVEYPTCANMGFTRAAYELAGGFNENLLVAEDDDFIWKLKKNGETNICIQDAIMRMDWGDRRRQRKRAWRYGKGIVNLLLRNRDLSVYRFRKNPDILLYPSLLLAYPFMIVFSFVRPYFILIPIFVSTALIVRKGFSKRSVIDHIDHFIYAAGTLFEISHLPVKRIRTSPILQYPNEFSAYVYFLNSALNDSKKVSRLFPVLTKSATINLLLFPFTSLMLKIRGIKVINIHWLIGKWNLHWAARKWQKQILFYWFKLWILSFRIFKIKIVYTVHDLDSHAHIFPDDKKAIAWLISKVDGLVFLNDYSASVIGIPKRSVHSRIIPEGPIKLVTGVSRNEMRQRLLVPDENILLVLVGNLQEYKGIDLLLLGAKTLPGNFSIRVAGVCQANYLAELNELLKTKALKEIDVKLDAGFLSDSDYAGYLVAADYFIYPCRNINNSGSLNSALSAGLPVIVPDTKELDWITPDSKIILHKDITGDFDFNRLFDELSTIESEQYSKLLVGASAWTEKRSWSHNSSSYLALYKEVLNG